MLSVRGRVIHLVLRGIILHNNRLRPPLTPRPDCSRLDSISTTVIRLHHLAIACQRRTHLLLLLLRGRGGLPAQLVRPPHKPPPPHRRRLLLLLLVCTIIIQKQVLVKIELCHLEALDLGHLCLLLQRGEVCSPRSQRGRCGPLFEAEDAVVAAEGHIRDVV